MKYMKYMKYIVVIAILLTYSPKGKVQSQNIDLDSLLGSNIINYLYIAKYDSSRLIETSGADMQNPFILKKDNTEVYLGVNRLNQINYILINDPSFILNKKYKIGMTLKELTIGNYTYLKEKGSLLYDYVSSYFVWHLDNNWNLGFTSQGNPKENDTIGFFFKRLNFLYICRD